MTKTVYVFGNEDVPEDSAPFALCDGLSKDFPSLEFIKVAPNADLPFAGQESVIIFDTIQGIPTIKVFNDQDLKHLVLSPRTSVHDFDLGFQLKFLMKIGKLKHITLIGLPMGVDVPYDSIHETFRKLVAQDIQGS
jgi:Ni,Fe-hydrogenase maturation factor